MEVTTAFVETIVGEQRMGKSSEAAHSVALDKGKNIVVEPQFSITPKIIAQRIAQWRQEEVFVDLLGWTKKVPQYVNIRESDAQEELERLAEERIHRQDLKSILYARRNLDPAVSVLIDERTDEGLSVFQYQKKFEPLWWLSAMTEYDSRELGDLLRGCKKRKVREKAEGWLYLNGVQKRMELGPLKRLVDPLTDPSVMARCGNLDSEDVISKYNTILVSGAGASEDAISLLLAWWVYKGIQWVEKFKQPLTITVDESANIGMPGRGIFSDRVLRAALLLAKHGGSFRYIFHSPFSVDEEIRHQLFDMASVIKCYRLKDPQSVEFMAKIMSAPNLNPYQISHTDIRERQVNAGFDEVVVKETVPFKGWAMRDENLSGDIRTRKQFMPRYGREKDETVHYRPLGDQDRLTGKGITTLGPQWRYQREGQGAWCEKAPTLINPWVFDTCLERRVAEFLETILGRSEYQWARVQKPKGPPWERGKKKSGKA